MMELITPCVAQIQDGLSQANGFITDLRGLETTPVRGMSGKGISLLVASGGVTSMLLTGAIYDQLHAAPSPSCSAGDLKTLSWLFWTEEKATQAAIIYAQ
jgi:hypothetical protein